MTLPTPWPEVTLKAALAALGAGRHGGRVFRCPPDGDPGPPRGGYPAGRHDPRDELANLLEETTATAAWHASRNEETFPAAVVDRLRAGDNPIRVYREHRGRTLSELAQTVGLARDSLSEIETGQKTGPLAVLKRLATALEVDLDDLIP
ncbi:MAG: hypothetical protein FD149_2186 [Rhodospirillaceae bacterium]|nr:MAG: hypothetical protein FD149_2186 [Rhodospirillaceae bacterium]